MDWHRWLLDSLWEDRQKVRADMTTRTEKEIKSLTKEQNYLLGYEDGTKDTIDRIKQAREEMQEKAYYMDDIYCMKTIKIDDALEILDKLIADSED